MAEITCLMGSIGQMDLEFVEREATPQLFMKLGIQLHLAGLSLSNTVSTLEVFGASRARSAVHNWVHTADLQPESGHSPDDVAVDETVIQITNERYWLYAAVDPTPTNCAIRRLNRPEPTLSQSPPSPNSARNIMLTTSRELPAVLVCSQDVSCERCVSRRECHSTTTSLP